MSQYVIRRAGPLAFTAKDIQKALKTSHKEVNGVSVRRIFWDAFTASMFQQLERSYRARSAGKADGLGNTWPALSVATIRRKGSSAIMIDTGRLLSSLSPGKITGNRYVPPEEQVVELTPESLILSTSVPYAARASKARPIWPNDIQEWVAEATKQGLEAVAQEIAKR